MKDRFVYVVVFVFALTFVVTGILSSIHISTRERVEENALLVYQQSVLQSFGDLTQDRSEILSRYASLDRLDQQDGGAEPIYVDVIDGRPVVATTFVGPGVWGDISGVVAMSVDLETIVGVSILDQNETPGLGGRITEPEFLAQFAGEQVGSGELSLARGSGDTDKENASIDGISGATGSSRAIYTIVNEAIARLRARVPAADLA